MKYKEILLSLTFIIILIFMILIKPKLYWQDDEKLFNKAIKTLKIDYCNKIKDQMKSDFCLYKIANLTNSYEPCKIIKTDYWKAICNTKFLPIIKNESLCKEIPYAKDKSKCYMLLAEVTGNISYCNNTLSEKACIFDIAIKNLNATLCNELSLLNKDICIIKIAKGLNNSELCNNINFKKIRESCFNYFAKNTS